MTVRWGHRQYLAAQNPIDARSIDAASAQFSKSAEELGDASDAVENVVALLQLVASEPVRTAALAVQERAKALSKQELDTFGTWHEGGLGPDEVQPWFDATKGLDKAEEALAEAISAELELDR